MILFIVSGLLIGYIGYKRGYNDANKNINGDTSRKDPRNEDA
nr:MAG TPA: ATP synthase subunit 9 [Caudoviricetes sp.]